MKNTTQMLKALSEEIRLRLISMLCHGELCVCDLAAALDLPQSTISRHLSYLKNAGWIHGERRGVWMYYRLADMPAGFHEELLGLLARHLPQTKRGEADITRLAEHVRQKQGNAC